MNKLSVSVMAIGLLLSASAMAQDTKADTQKSDAPRATTTQSAPDRQNKDTGRLQNDRSNTKQNVQIKAGHERSARARDERRERSGSISTRSRETVGIRVNDREFRHRHRGHRTVVRFEHPHCRNIIVKTRHHHHVVVRHIRRCS